VALTYATAIDAPERFARSRDVGAHFGLTPRKYASQPSADRMLLGGAQQHAVQDIDLAPQVVPGLQHRPLTYATAIDAPERFARSRDVGAHFGLTPRKYASGEIDRNGRISKSGDHMVRQALFQAIAVA
jgi:transposase